MIFNSKLELSLVSRNMQHKITNILLLHQIHLFKRNFKTQLVEEGFRSRLVNLQ